MESKSLRFPNKKPVQLHENLWVMDGTWRNKFARRMTVIRLTGRKLLIHSAMKLNDAEKKWLESLGTVSYVFVPNKFHHSDAPWMIEQFPEAQLLAPQMLTEHFVKLRMPMTSLDVPEVAAKLAPDLKLSHINGVRFGETALLHFSSRTLIVCDLVFHMTKTYEGFEKRLMALNQIGDHMGPSLLFKWIFTQDRPRMLASVAEILQFDFDRVIMNHGVVVEKDGRNLMKEGFERIFGANCFRA